MDNYSLKAVPEMPEKLEIPNGSMGPNDKDVMAQLNISHPLQASELKYPAQQLSLNSQIIRNVHGIGAQLKYMMEINAASKVGRLPFLPSSNLSRDVLLGNDEMITPFDIYGSSEFSEKMVQPHAVMEKKLGIL
ncbi:putative Proteasome maturation factor UMP1 [Polypedilum vanderplanki]|uniref:Proteasome maturation factor UMP1 n=1 Tax=Polypedilum vanderplanki TaxID=319348 RepID=A0A9J6CMB5_POLVA|nr:putative Proteasome maturation factor UMP1 [Polypedilum vanderplanki]